MSLVKCEECGHQVSTAAAACPNCGRPTNISGSGIDARCRRTDTIGRHTAGPPHQEELVPTASDSDSHLES
jgi:hypothetical protein